MSEVVRVKPQKQYQWHQTKTQVTISLNIPNTNKANISIQAYDVLLIVTNKETKSSLHVFDLQAPIKKAAHRYQSGVLEITLQKKEEEEWKKLVSHLGPTEIRKRREESRKRQSQVVLEMQEKKVRLLDEYDRKATQELMKMQDRQRQQLQAKKRDERLEAEKRVFDGIDKGGNITPNSMLMDWDSKQKVAMEILERQEEEQRKSKFVQQKLKKRQNQIFTQQEASSSEVQALKLQELYEQIPIRKTQNVKVTMTEKPYPHVAVRETHFVDPPMPKSKTAIKGDQAPNIQERNPLWLKDKGDQLTKNKDYLSAINAYSEALKLDGSLLSALTNRSYCHFKLFNFQECMADCSTALQTLETQEEVGQNGAVKVKCRMAICMSWKGNLSESKSLFQQILSHQALTVEGTHQVRQSIHQIQQRVKSMQAKKKGDNFFKTKSFDEALKSYSESIDIDRNEYSLAHKGLVCLRLGHFQQTVKLCDESENAVLALTSNLSANLMDSRGLTVGLLAKIYLRKATALKQLGQYSESIATLRCLKSIDDKDTASTQIIKQVEVNINRQKYQKVKEQADNMTRSNDLQKALKKYKECLSLLTSQDLMEYLSVLLNQCVCHLKLNQMNQIVAVCIRGLKLIQSSSNIIAGLEQTKMTEFKVRFLIRKAKAYSVMNQRYNATSDIKQALGIDVQNPRIRSQLEEIRRQILK